MSTLALHQFLQEFLQAQRRTRKYWLFEWPVVALYLGLAGFQVLGPVPMARADNGDFPKILARLHISSSPLESQYQYYVPKRTVDRNWYWNSHLATSEFGIVYVGKFLGRQFLGRSRFDLRVLGILHGLLIGLALWYMLRALRSFGLSFRILSAALLLFMWTDVEYVQFFSTAYADAASLVFFCLFSAITLNALLSPANRSLTWAVLFAVSGSLFLWSKPQHAPLMLLMTALAVWIGLQAGQPRIRYIWLATPLLLVGTVTHMLRTIDPEYRFPAIFSVIFARLVPTSQNPRATLHELGFSDSMQQYAGKHAFTPGLPQTPAFHHLILTTVPTGKLLYFYVSHPRQTEQYLEIDWMRSATDINLDRSWGISRFTKEDIDHHRTNKNFTWWSGGRSLLMVKKPLFVPCFLVVSLAFALVCMLWRRLGRIVSCWPLLVFAVGAGISGFATGSLLDATDTVRHIVLLQFATDLTVFTIGVGLYQLIANPAALRSVSAASHISQVYTTSSLPQRDST